MRKTENAARLLPIAHSQTPEPTAGIDYGQLNQHLGYMLRRAQIAVFQDFFRTVGAHDISPAQYSTLTVIECNPGLTQTQVADALGIKKANFVAMIKALEERGLARRTPTPHDRRSFALHLTPAGAALTRTLHDASMRHERRLRDAVGEAAYKALFEPMRRIAGIGRESASGPRGSAD
jgi:DNA-binding MarR family transcriptional regulator